MANLFSQIPAQVLDKVKVYKAPEGNNNVTPKRVKFYDGPIRPVVIHEDSSTDLESEINVEDNFDEPTSSFQVSFKEQEIPKKYSDAIVQTEPLKSYKSTNTQTHESLLTRPLNDSDAHRLNTKTFSPIRPLIKSRSGQQPPLRLGLTLRGKKRKVFYPQEENDTADGA